MSAVVLLARTSEGSKAGPIGLAVVLLLCIACYFLFKSMSKHLRNVRENFPDAAAPPPPTAATTAEPPAAPAEMPMRADEHRDAERSADS